MLFNLPSSNIVLNNASCGNGASGHIPQAVPFHPNEIGFQPGRSLTLQIKLRCSPADSAATLSTKMLLSNVEKSKPKFTAFEFICIIASQQHIKRVWINWFCYRVRIKPGCNICWIKEILSYSLYAFCGLWKQNQGLTWFYQQWRQILASSLFWQVSSSSAASAPASLIPLQQFD